LIRRKFLKLIAAAMLVQAHPAAAQSNAETFNVFFDFGKGEVAADAKKLLDRIVEIIPPTARVTLSGHCDSAELEPEKLGFTRANAVLTHLLRHQSMSKVRFNVVNEGASKPLVQAPPRTREPRNRRVEVSIELR
jgi:outer membrane protein OmpA-like peptidoglycan-associated protein